MIKSCTLCVIWLCLFMEMFYHGMSAEYQIRPDTGISYLEQEIPQVGEDIFPESIRINISLTQATGTLLCSMDSNGNQFIIRIVNETDPVVIVELRGMQKSWLLRKLCKCQQCAYRPLDISVEIESVVRLQCNKQINQIFKYDNTKSVNKDFPAKAPKKSGKTNAAFLWLMNTPPNDKGVSRTNQMQGCLFSVDYKNNPILMNIKGSAISQGCSTTCKQNSCLGGKCYETYFKHPVCDCTDTFGSGLSCNDESKMLNRKYKGQFLFSSIKLSWRTNVKKLFELGKEHPMFTIIQHDGIALQLYKPGGSNGTYKELFGITKNENEDKILILSLENNLLRIKRRNDMVTVSLNNSHEPYDYLALSSGEGVIDVAYKVNAIDVQWKKWSFIEETSEPWPTSDNNNLFAIFVILPFIIVAIILLILWKEKRLKKEKRQKKEKRLNNGRKDSKNEEESIPLIHQHNKMPKDFVILHFPKYSLVCWKQFIHEINAIITIPGIAMNRPVVIYQIDNYMSYVPRNKRIIQLYYNGLQHEEYVVVNREYEEQVIMKRIRDLRQWKVTFNTEGQDITSVKLNDMMEDNKLTFDVQMMPLDVGQYTHCSILLYSNPDQAEPEPVKMYLKKETFVGEIKEMLMDFLTLSYRSKIELAIKEPSYDQDDITNVLKKLFMANLQLWTMEDISNVRLWNNLSVEKTQILHNKTVVAKLQNIANIVLLPPLDESDMPQIFTEDFLLIKGLNESFPVFAVAHKKISVMGDIISLISAHLHVEEVLLFNENNQELSSTMYISQISDIIHYVNVLPFQNIEKGDQLENSTSVYKCSMDDKPFALKRLSDKQIFNNEALTALKIWSNSRVIKYHDLYRDKSFFYIRMDLMETSLDIYCEYKPLREDEIVKLSSQILEGLAYLHELKIIHRNLEGSNILLDATHESVKLTDFKTAKYPLGTATDEKATGKNTKIMANWMAPEVTRGKPHGLKADVWSFGMTMIEMIKGDDSFPEESSENVEVIHGYIEKISIQKKDRFSPNLIEIIKRCLNGSDKDRPNCSHLLLEFYGKFDCLKEIDHDIIQ